jgi:hypothetical protein
MPPFLKTKWFRAAAAAALVIVLYAVLGFVVAPKLVRSALLKDVPKAIDATPSVGEIHINPFLLQATIENFTLAGAGGEKLLGFQRLFIDFQVSSLWHRAYTFANIDLTAPFVSAVMAKDGRLNLAQLKPKPSPKPQPDEKGEALPAVRIGSFKVTQGSLAYEDRSRPDVFAARLEPLNFELRDFTTGADGGRFTFTAASKLGERLEWHGHLSVDPVESDGEFQVVGLKAHTLWEYLQDQVNFVIDSGTIDLAATYRFSLKDPATTNLQVDLSKAALTDFTVRPRQADGESAAEPWITIPAFAVTGSTLDLATHQAQVDLVSLTGLKLSTWLEPDKTLNLSKLGGARTFGGAAAAPATAPTPTSPAATAAAAPTLTASSSAAAAASTPWTYHLRQLQVRDASIATEDRSVQPAVKVLLAPLSLQVNNITQDLTKPVTVALDTRINGSGSLTVGGEVTPQPVMANVDVKLSDLDLTAIQPYVSQQTAMTLMSGRFGVDGKLHYGAQPAMPATQFTGNLEVEKLHTVDDALHDDFINWDRLEVQGIKYTQGPDRLDIEQITAHKLYARVIIESDSSINVKRVLKIPTTATATATADTGNGAAAAVDAAGASATTPAMPAHAATRATGRRSAANRPVAAAAAPARQTMPMSIKKILIEASQANFADFSVKPNFATGIQKLEGSVVGLSSKPGSRAKVDLHGAIDAFSPVSITGEINVLGPLYTDLTMSFRNISLPVFDPYSGKFAGYNIAKGKLTTEFHYLVDGRKLDAQHHIVVEQLEFGDKTPSKEAVSLPLKLAVSLLKDRNGVIDLNIPVTGSLDDPQFRLAPIIWKVFVNILEKAVTAPFALLGSLFGGGPDLQFIDFQPGVATLDDSAADKAKTVAKALIERPQLQIDVPIAVVPDVDRPALIEAQYQAQLEAARIARVSSKKAAVAPGAATPSFDQLDPATRLDLLTQVYAQDAGGEPKYPDEVTNVKSKPDLVAAKIAFLSREIHAHIVVGDGELQALGQQRALALQKALLADSQVAPERVFLVANDKATAKDGAVRLELSLK